MLSKVPSNIQPSMLIPSSEVFVEVQLINTTTKISIESSGFVQPPIQGHEKLRLPTFCFLIKHGKSKKNVLFDCGARTNWRDLPPKIVEVIAEAEISVTKGVDEILTEAGFELQSLNAIIWSHWHWDHVGDASRFHKQTEICVGPSFKQNFMPGYPTAPDAPMLETDFVNRTIREIDFTDGPQIGGFRSFDFFGDGSLYLLDVPGHAIGHMAALARTSPSTFILMAGDTCHFAGVFRPSPGLVLPTTVPASVNIHSRFSRPCPSSNFLCLHPNMHRASSSPFYKISEQKGGWYIDPKTAQNSVNRLQELDADENILVLLAHDTALEDVMEKFPKHNLNDWKERGWKEKFAWNFLNELHPGSGKAGQELEQGVVSK